MAVLASPAPAAEPMSELNTTPLIDVMLVLLVMFIITIPAQTHSVKLDLPNGSPPVDLRQDRNKLVVTEAGALLFNGAAVTRPELQSLLLAAGQLPQEPELQLQPEAAAPYGVVDEVLVMTKKAGLKRLGFVGNEAYARF
jgi:biopolymer transport protein ExbD